MNLNEDYTAAVLSGIPVFLVNREYVKSTLVPIIKSRYSIILSTGYIVSVIEFYDRSHSGGHQYEAMITEEPLSLANIDPSSVYRGDAMCIHKILTNLENN